MYAERMEVIQALISPVSSGEEVVHCWTESAFRLGMSYSTVLGNFAWFRNILKRRRPYRLVVRSWYGFIIEEAANVPILARHFLSYCHDPDQPVQDVTLVHEGLSRLLQLLLPCLQYQPEPLYNELYPISLFHELTGLTLPWAQFLLARVKKYQELRTKYPRWKPGALLTEAEIIKIRQPILEAYFPALKLHCTRLALALGVTLHKIFQRYSTLDRWLSCRDSEELEALLKEPLLLLLIYTHEPTELTAPSAVIPLL